jgi:hypothetical protein
MPQVPQPKAEPAPVVHSPEPTSQYQAKRANRPIPPDSKPAGTVASEQRNAFSQSQGLYGIQRNEPGSTGYQANGPNAHAGPIIINPVPTARTLLPEQAGRLEALLRNVGPYEIAIRHSQGDIESQRFADALEKIVVRAGWTVRQGMFLIQEREQVGIVGTRPNRFAAACRSGSASEGPERSSGWDNGARDGGFWIARGHL